MFSYYASPFPHIVWDNLELEVEQVDVTLKESDLFRFYQSMELKDDPVIAQVKQFLLENKELWKETFGVNISSMDAFMSEYRDHCYLLPHDDRLDDRQLAWIYYLDAGIGGDLVLYNGDERPTTEAKRVTVKPGRLIVFPVGSWHMVAEVTGGVRRAVGGWLYE